MLFRDPSRREERIEQMYRRLGDRNPVCISCEEDDPTCLQQHHIAGQAFSDELVWLCANCHCKVTLDQKDHPTEIDGFSREDVAKIRRLMGWADIHRRQAEFFDRQALELYEKLNQSTGGSNDS